MIRKHFHQYWVFECPDAIMTCSVLKCPKKSYMVFGGHDKTLYLMNDELMILADVEFDGWCRCTYPIDIDGDGCDDLLVGTGDGRFLVLKFDKKSQKLAGIMNYKSEGKVNCCVAGDLYRDGNIELIFGGENKKLFILKDIYSKEPIETFYYDSWVMSCTLGFLKFPKSTMPTFCLLIGTKNGLLQLIQIQDNKPDIIWQQNVYSSINDIKIGDVTNDGYNEIIVASDDSYIKVYNCEGKRLKFIKIENHQSKSKSKRHKLLNRPTKLLIHDIDGDKANEIVVGCADGILRVFHNKNLNSKNFELKWKNKTASSIKSVCPLIEVEDGKNVTHILFGGYDRTLRNISDFEWGKLPFLKIPQRFKIPEIPLIKPNKDGEKGGIEEEPTNLRGYITKLLGDHGFFLTLDLLINNLLEKGYKRREIEEEIESMKTEKFMSYGKTDVQVWSLVNEDIDDAISNELQDSKKGNSEKSRKKKT